jgi:hypothetical protein
MLTGLMLAMMPGVANNPRGVLSVHLEGVIWKRSLSHSFRFGATNRATTIAFCISVHTLATRIVHLRGLVAVWHFCELVYDYDRRNLGAPTTRMSNSNLCPSRLRFTLP